MLKTIGQVSSLWHERQWRHLIPDGGWTRWVGPKWTRKVSHPVASVRLKVCRVYWTSRRTLRQRSLDGLQREGTNGEVVRLFLFLCQTPEGEVLTGGIGLCQDLAWSGHRYTYLGLSISRTSTKFVAAFNATLQISCQKASKGRKK